MIVLHALKTIPAFLIEMAILIVLVAVKFGRLAEERRRGVPLDPRWPTVAAAGFLLVGLVLGLAGQFPGIYGFRIDNHPVQWAQNVLIMGAYFSLQLLYLPALAVRPAPVRREAALFGIVAASLAVLSGLLWAFGIPGDDSAARLHNEPLVALFYAIGTVYLTYIAGSVALRSARYAGKTVGWTAAGLTFTALGAGMQSLGSLTRITTLTTAVTTGGYSDLVYRLGSPLFNLSKPVVVVGLVLPLIAGRFAAVRRWLLRRSRYRQMRTLWVVSLMVFPEIERRDAPAYGSGSEADGAGRGGFNFRFVRRVTECRDGLSRASGHRDLEPPGDVEAQVDSPAQRFWAELSQCGVDPETLTGADLDEEAQRLAEVSTRLRRQGIDWISGSPSSTRNITPPAPSSQT